MEIAKDIIIVVFTITFTILAGKIAERILPTNMIKWIGIR